MFFLLSACAIHRESYIFKEFYGGGVKKRGRRTIRHMDSYYPFVYNDMWKFYRTQIGTPTDRVFMRVYDVDYVALKYGKENDSPMQPFLQRGMDVKILDSNDPLYGDTGTYVIHDSQETLDRSSGSRDKKCLYIIRPVEHHLPTLGTFWTGDHFTFLVGARKVPPESRLQFHQTIYIPNENGLPIGDTRHRKSPLPIRFYLPSDVTTFEHMVKPAFRPNAQLILDIMSRPWNNLGAGRKSRRARRGAMPETGGTFDDIWKTLPIRRLEVIGIRRYDIRASAVFDVTMFVTDRFKHAPDCSKLAFVFRVTARDDLHAAIAAQFNGWSWDSFGPPSHTIDDDE